MSLNPLVDSRDVRFVLFEMLGLDKINRMYSSAIPGAAGLLINFGSDELNANICPACCQANGAAPCV